MALNPVAKKWVAALRSGKYKQGKNQLRFDNKFCCLGVLCDLAVKAKIIAAPIYRDGQYSYAKRAGVLPDKVTEWAGLSHNSGMMSHKYGDLTHANDQGVRFKIIAKIIESKPEGLFKK